MSTETSKKQLRIIIEEHFKTQHNIYSYERISETGALMWVLVLPSVLTDREMNQRKQKNYYNVLYEIMQLKMPQFFI